MISLFSSLHLITWFIISFNWVDAIIPIPENEELTMLEKRCADIICVMDDSLIEVVYEKNLQTSVLQRTFNEINKCFVATLRVQR